MGTLGGFIAEGGGFGGRLGVAEVSAEVLTLYGLAVDALVVWEEVILVFFGVEEVDEREVEVLAVCGLEADFLGVEEAAG